MIAKKPGPRPSRTKAVSKLTDTQLIILSEASQKVDRRIAMPPRLKGNAGNMAFNALLKRRLVERVDDSPETVEQPNGKPEAIADHRRFRISDAGLQAIGLVPEGSAAADRTTATKATKPNLNKGHTAKTRSKKATGSKDLGRPTPASRKAPGGKQQVLIGMLRRANGAALDELVKASGWQPHSMRGFLSGTVKTKLGLRLERTSDPRRGSVYRIFK